MEPTPENIQAITRDLSHGLYSPAYVNFLSSVPRPLLEDFASQIATSGASEHIAQVFDQYLNFVVAEPDLFSLGLGNDAYYKINSPKTTDEDLDGIVDNVVSGLFSVSVTMGKYQTLPWIIGRRFNWLSRYHSNHTVPQGWCGRIDSNKTGPQIAGPHPQFQRQPLLGQSERFAGSAIRTAGTYHHGPKC